MRRLVGRPSVLGLGLAVLALVPAVANPYLVYVTSIALLYVILAVGLNLLLGYAGQFAFANAALFGIGAYATGLTQFKLGWSFWLALPAGALFTALAGLLVALPALRLSGLYLALATMAFAQFTQWTMLNWESVTFGAGGFKVPPPSFSWLGVSSATGVYYLTLAITAGLVVAAWNTVRSRVGRAMIAVRDSEVAAEALGVDLARTKTLAFALSAFYAGTAGGLYSATLNFVAPEGFDLFQMVVHFSMVVVGGLGSVWGAVLGAGLLVGVQEALRAFKSAQEIAFGLVLMTAIIFLPDGLVSLLRRRVPGWDESLRRVAPPGCRRAGGARGRWARDGRGPARRLRGGRGDAGRPRSRDLVRRRPCARRREPRGRRGRDPRDHRTERGGEDHAPERDLRLRAAGPRRGHRRRLARHRLRRERGRRPRPHAHVPDHPALPRHDRPRERHDGPASPSSRRRPLRGARPARGARGGGRGRRRGPPRARLRRHGAASPTAWAPSSASASSGSSRWRAPS